MSEDATPCDSKFKTASGDIISCKNLGRHVMHQGLSGGQDFIWRRDHEYREYKIPPEPKPKASELQVGGNHYKDKGNLQPIDVIDAWELDFYEGSALKYLARHRQKNGAEDIKKAIHYLQLLLERQYP